MLLPALVLHKQETTEKQHMYNRLSLPSASVPQKFLFTSETDFHEDRVTLILLTGHHTVYGQPDISFAQRAKRNASAVENSGPK